MIPEHLTTIKVTLWHCLLYLLVTSTDPNTGADLQEYDTCEGKRFLSDHNSFKSIFKLQKH